MNGTQTGIAVSGAIGYGILDPTSILLVGLVIAGLIVLYFMGKIFSTRHIRTSEHIDREKAQIKYDKWVQKLVERQTQKAQKGKNKA